ncbi:peptidase inhibitor family I36 protein [Planobispora longispora]|uniref:Peptidase inhibitor family I36 n=1 Tax=Planobispora longispora TaxID=28887 RepID=A0A8J3W6Z3_9ACTN|nr:peptidase inhibitor family I36 protein [Planobispora longispora]GIH79039.1 hypothetical protein Plo01_54680 [Planobispora longispora]
MSFTFQQSRRPATLLLATAVTLLATLSVTAAPSAAATASESAALQRAAEQCGPGEICFWERNDYVGTPWRWKPQNGYRDLPPYLHDNVGSFYANSVGCFIDWDPRLYVKVALGDYSRAYKYEGKFGSRIDAVRKYVDCHA